MRASQIEPRMVKYPLWTPTESSSIPHSKRLLSSKLGPDPGFTPSRGFKEKGIRYVLYQPGERPSSHKNSALRVRYRRDAGSGQYLRSRGRSETCYAAKV